MITLKTVNDMYKYASSNNLKLLSNYSSDFWAEYITNHEKYDKLFRRLYLSFKYFMQEDDESISEITTDFIDDVYNHLLVNDRKYSELYRIHVLPDTDYSLTDNYSITEIMDKDTTSNDDNVYGSRTDTTDNTSTGYVAPYDSNNFSENTQVVDDIDFTKGQQRDDLDNTYTEDYTLTRKGNIGVQTVSDMLEKHRKLWTSYEFYTLIFREICKELLLV